MIDRQKKNIKKGCREELGQKGGLWRSKVGYKQVANPENEENGFTLFCIVTRLIHEYRYNSYRGRVGAYESFTVRKVGISRFLFARIARGLERSSLAK